MSELSKFLVESILLEADSIDKVVVVYSGRFQPFHKGHYATYDNLVKKFGKDSVYIGTSNVTDSKKSPFNFKEKKAIMTNMFGIPSSKIVNIRNPYAPEEILNKYDEDTTGLIVVVGEKDQNRLSGKYFAPYKGKVTEPYLDRGYVYASPATANPISGTDVRYWLSAGSAADRKKNFTKAYPRFDDQIFKLITLKLKGLKECINEEIKLNVKVGDTLLMGKFKNKKVVVKSIGEDEWGMPTINGKKAVTFRIPKKDDLKEMGLGGGAGVGLSLPGGYINGAPDTKDVKKNSKKLNNKSMSGYEPVKESILLEGGAYGHMNHPFDIEMNLTFGDLKNIVKKALNGDLELAREKTDGQALAISWVNGRLVAARNKSHLKNKGVGAMSIGQVASKFGGRGGLTDAYNFAMQDLSKAISGLSEAQKKKVFKDGACFMNLEVIYPTSVNVIPYGQPLLVFHGTFEYDVDGSVIGENQDAAKVLAGMIKQINAHVQSQYTIQGPPMQSLPKSDDLTSHQGKYLGMISKLQSEFGLKDSDGVADYHQAWWTNFVEKGAKKLDSQQKLGLVKRWAFGNKGFRIADIKDDKLKAWAEQIDKQDQQKIGKQNLMRFEEIFLGVGADVLSFMTSVLTANPDSAKKQMVSRLQSTISQVKGSGDPKKIAKLKLELERLNALGGFEKIVPNEGIVFVYNGNTYKLTGAFAPLNQILGIFFDK
jgi:hypothetical protein